MKWRSRGADSRIPFEFEDHRFHSIPKTHKPCAYHIHAFYHLVVDLEL